MSQVWPSPTPRKIHSQNSLIHSRLKFSFDQCNLKGWLGAFFSSLQYSPLPLSVSAVTQRPMQRHWCSSQRSLCHRFETSAESWVCRLLSEGCWQGAWRVIYAARSHYRSNLTFGKISLYCAQNLPLLNTHCCSHVWPFQSLKQVIKLFR